MESSVRMENEIWELGIRRDERVEEMDNGYYWRE
jgi:hypothetical protein